MFQPEETPLSVAKKLSDALILNASGKYENDEKRLDAVKKLVKVGNYVEFNLGRGNFITLSNESSGIKIIHRDTNVETTFKFSPRGSYAGSERSDLHFQSDGCTRLKRVDLPEPEAAQFGDIILLLLHNKDRAKVFNKGRIGPTLPCIPRTPPP